MVWLSQPYCWLMGSTAMLMLTRSMLHSMKAKKHRVTIVQRRFQNGWLTAVCACERRQGVLGTPHAQEVPMHIRKGRI